MPSRELLVRYEDLVSKPEGTIRLLLEQVGVPFEAACLRFYEQSGYTATPSYAQVSEKLNDRSIGRHRHYAAHLREFEPLLRPVLSAMSYRAP
jgi:hypothetical protein